MKRMRQITAGIMALIMMVSFVVVPASARNIGTSACGSELEQYLDLGTYAVLNPIDFLQALQYLREGDTNSVEDTIGDSETTDILLELNRRKDAVSQLLQIAALTYSSDNVERGVVPTARISLSGTKIPDEAFPQGLRHAELSDVFVFPITFRKQSGVKFTLRPFMAFYDSRDYLVILCVLQNQTNRKIKVKGTYSIQFGSGRKIIARGIPAKFDTPVTLSPTSGKGTPTPELNDGHLNMCFARFIFGPGTYDKNTDFNTITRLTGSFEPNYQFVN